MRAIQLGVTVLLAWCADADAGIVHVANFGQDGPTCGDSTFRCRSISQAIRNASDGDTIIVAPGLYGDLNRNGVTGELGEESGVGDCRCLIAIDKRVSVLSERGSAATVIDASRTSLIAVRIYAPDAGFGYDEQGFTVLGGAEDAIAAFTGPFEGSVVRGNRVRGGLIGIRMWIGEIHGNEVTDTTGFAGISLDSGRVSDNVVARNNFGIHVLRATVENNIVSDNRAAGLQVFDPRSAEITRNIFIRNHGPGVSIPFPRLENFVGIFSNDFIGNDPIGMCGILNRTGDVVWATNNFWAGAADFGVWSQLPCVESGATTHVEPAKLQPHW